VSDSSVRTKVAAAEVATEGNKVSTSFHLSHKATAVRCWQDAVDATGLDDKVLAVDARMTPSHYSKVATGQQGDLLGLVDKLGEIHPALRADFFARLTEAQGIDPVQSAAEQLVLAATRFLRLSAAGTPKRMARAAGHVSGDRAVNE
jgi:hypothetical protein